MKKKVIFTTLVAFLLLFLVVLAGLNAVYTVTNVHANFCTFSAEGETEARKLQEKLDSFVDQSSVFLDLDDVQAAVEEYPCFRLESAEKRYPDKLELKIVERKEAFSYLLENGKYAVLDERGDYLYEKDSNQNRISGENILLLGDFKYENGEKGDYFGDLVTIFSALRDVLTEVRANVISFELELNGAPTTTKIDYINIRMREGAVIKIEDPHVRANEKARLAIECYAGTGAYEGKGLTDVQRVTEVITVFEREGSLLLSPQL